MDDNVKLLVFYSSRCKCNNIKRGATIDEVGKPCSLFIVENNHVACVVSMFSGTCVDKINSFNCNCPTGFSGVRCDYNIDDCLATPCVNGMQFYVIESTILIL